MPRAAVLSLHARVDGVGPSAWEDPTFVQVWGPRFSTYVVARDDLPIFTLGRLPDDARGRHRAEDLAERLEAFLGGRAMPFGAAGRGLGEPPNRLRYATATGRVAIRWDGARQPTIRTVPPPAMSPLEARIELARRYLHVFGPGTSASFAQWAGIPPASAHAAFVALEALSDASVPVRTPIGDAWILSSDEPALSALDRPTAAARLLPSGDTFYLLQGADRELLVPRPEHRAALWTSRVWPGAVLVRGEIAGTWRRAGSEVTIESWRPFAADERQAVEAEAASLPLPDLRTPIQVRWGTGR